MNTGKPIKIKKSISLDSDIIERIQKLADEDDRSFSQYVNKILRNHLDGR